MKRVLSLLLALIMVLGCAVSAFAADDEIEQQMSDNYYEETETGGRIEAKYTAMGKYKTSYKNVTIDDERIGSYEIFYPTKLKSSTKKWPVIIFVNGTGIKSETIRPLMKHMASWGFIVLGNQDEGSADGVSSNKTVNYILKKNKNKKSVFYGKVDTTKFGITGHSQGGTGTIKTVTEQPNGKIFKSMFTASATTPGLSKILEWEYDVSGIKIPWMMVGGTGAIDANIISTPSGMKENYDGVSGNGLTVMARRKDTEHGYMLYKPDGYMTAWFMYTLNGDKTAKKAFLGSKPELKNNDIWQDVAIKK